MTVMARSGARHRKRGGDAEQQLLAVCDSHYRSLTRLAALLVNDAAAAEAIAAAAFATLRDARPRVSDERAALAFLHRRVVSGARSFRAANGSVPAPGAPSAPTAPSPQQALILASLQALPQSQREVLVLRHYADLSDRQIATAMRVSLRTVESSLSSGAAAVRAALEPGPDPPPSAG
jgi:DNA-directed RNA polymerase specialized sigma24 family protein